MGVTIQWLGHACFAIRRGDYTLVIDPYNSDYINGYPKLRVKADKVLVSHEHFGHNYREGVVLSGRPGATAPLRSRRCALRTISKWATGAVLRISISSRRTD